jgi:hypothetical protein
MKELFAIGSSFTYIVQAKKNLALSRGRGCQCSDRTDLRKGTGGRGALSEQRAGGASKVDGGACKYHCECMRGELWIGREEESEAGWWWLCRLDRAIT